MLWKCLGDYSAAPQAIQVDVCLHEGFLCENTWKSVGGAKGELDNKWLLWPCLLALWDVLPPSPHPQPPPLSTSATSWPPPPSIYTQRHNGQKQWTWISLVELKIANNCACEWRECGWSCVCVSPAMATGLCWWASPLRLQTFLSINIKEILSTPLLLIAFCLHCLT